MLYFVFWKVLIIIFLCAFAAGHWKNEVLKVKFEHKWLFNDVGFLTWYFSWFWRALCLWSIDYVIYLESRPYKMVLELN